MVKKKTTTKKARSAPAKAKKTYTKKSDTRYIPAAAATVGIVYANADNIKRFMDKVSADGLKAFPNVVTGKGSDYKWLRQQFVSGNQLVKDAVYYAGGYVGGEIAKKYLPNVIKKPMGKIAKKIPRM